MNYLFKTAAGVMSALVLAAGAGFTANNSRAYQQCSPESCTSPSLCVSGADCTNISNADLQKLIGECENTSDMLKVLLDNKLCSKDDLNNIIDSGSCTVDDVCKALENCNTDSCDIVSILENACADQNESCAEGSAADCEGDECEAVTSCTSCTEEQTASDKACESDAASEQASEDSRDCSDSDCTAICDSDCTSEECKDSDCSNGSSAAPACSDSDCLPEAVKENSSAPDNAEKKSYSNINDILRALGIEINTDTSCTSDGSCTGNTSQGDEAQTDTETAKPTENDTDSSNADTEYEIADYEAEVVRLVNEIRTDYGLSELTINKELSAVARLKSEDMRDLHYFSHNSPTYGSPFEMMHHFGINYKTAGENIAMGQRTPQEVVNGWMNSEGHRANILNASFKEIGVGYAENGHYWTQMFIG